MGHLNQGIHANHWRKALSGLGGGGHAMKKFLLIALAAVAGLFVYRQIQADRAEQDLWTEATDAVPAGSDATV